MEQIKSEGKDIMKKILLIYKGSVYKRNWTNISESKNDQGLEYPITEVKLCLEGMGTLAEF